MKKWILAGILFGAAAVGLFSNGEMEVKTTQGLTREEMDRFIDAFDMNLEFKKPELPVYYAPVYAAKDEWDGKTLEKVDNFRLVAQDTMVKSAGSEDRMNKFLLPGMWVKFDYKGKTYLRVILANVDIYVEDLSDSSRRPYNLTDKVFARQYREAGVKGEAVQVTIPGDSQDLIQEFYKAYLEGLNLGYGPGTGKNELFYLQPPIMSVEYLEAVRVEVTRALTASTPKEMILDGSVFGEWLPMNLADGVTVESGEGGITLSIKNWPHDDRVCNGF